MGYWLRWEGLVLYIYAICGRIRGCLRKPLITCIVCGVIIRLQSTGLRIKCRVKESGWVQVRVFSPIQQTPSAAEARKRQKSAVLKNFRYPILGKVQG